MPPPIRRATDSRTASPTRCIRISTASRSNGAIRTSTAVSTPTAPRGRRQLVYRGVGRRHLAEPYLGGAQPEGPETWGHPSGGHHLGSALARPQRAAVPA